MAADVINKTTGIPILTKYGIGVVILGFVLWLIWRYWLDPWLKDRYPKYKTWRERKKIRFEGVIKEKSEALKQEIQQGEKKDVQIVQPLLYRNRKAKFCGRNDDLTYLEDFCKSKERFLWSAVLGAGGSGKSRLAYEFAAEVLTKNRLERDWLVYFLHREDLSKLTAFGDLSCRKNVLLIVDYITGSAESLSTWIKKVVSPWCKKRGKKLRLLLLEREIPDRNNPSQSLWFKHFCVWQNVLYQNEFLELQPLSVEQALLPIAESYLGRDLTPSEKETFKQAMERIDPRLQRPLFAQCIAKAISENKPIENQTDVLHYALEQEQDRWNQLAEKKSEQLKRLLCFATLCGGVEDPPPKLLTKDWNTFGDQVLPIFHSVNAGGSRQEQEMLHPLEPDLLGEYFVLDTLRNLTQPKRKRWMQAAWDYNPKGTYDFLLRFAADYPEEDALLIQPEGEQVLKHFADILFTCIKGDVTLNRKREIAARLEQLHDQSGINEIAFYYCMSVLGLNGKGGVSLAEERSVVQRLHERSGHLAVVTWYALSLSGLSRREPSLVERCNVIDQLRQLHEQAENSLITFFYESSLDNLSYAGSSIAKKRCVIKQLRQLHEQCRNPTVTVAYAMNLCHLSYADISLVEKRNIILQIKQLHEQSRNSMVTEWYAKSLAFLSREDLPLNEKCDLIGQLRDLHEKNEAPEFIVAYAIALFGQVDAEFLLAEKRGLVEKLQQLHKENTSIIEKCSRLESLSYYEDVKYNMVANKYNIVAETYALGLVVLITNEPALKEKQALVDRLEQLWRQTKSSYIKELWEEAASLLE